MSLENKEEEVNIKNNEPTQSNEPKVSIKENEEEKIEENAFEEIHTILSEAKTDEDNEIHFDDFDMKLHQNESPEELLARLSKYIFDYNKQQNIKRNKFKFGDEYVVKLKYSHLVKLNSPFAKKYEEAIRYIIDNPQEESLDINKNEEIISKLQIGLNGRDPSFSDDYFEIKEHYLQTNQTRSFFPQMYKKDNLPYTTTLFALPLEYSPLVLEYFQEKLNNKSICLLGGGESVLDLTSNKDIHPKNIVNIDPFIEKDDISRNENGNYKSVLLNAEGKDLSSDLQKENIQQFDEIWASYSVPFYTKSGNEIANLFDNIDSLLAEGGNCRITPIMVQNSDCELALQNKLNELKDSGKYNFHYLEKKSTLILHKLKQQEDKHA